jgi:replication factor C subunit 2/4
MQESQGFVWSAITLPGRQSVVGLCANTDGMVSRIIEPLTSRCSKFRFKPLDKSSTQSRLEFIAEAEGVTVTPEVISALVSTSGGDLRRSITYLQSASRLSSSTTPPTPITPADIQEIAGVVPDHIIESFANVLGVDVVRPDSMEVDSGESRAKNFDGVRKKVKQLVRDGYSAAQILSQVRGRIE